MKIKISNTIQKELKSFEKKQREVNINKIIDESHRIIVYWLIRYTKNTLKWWMRNLEKELGISMSFDLVNEAAKIYTDHIENLHLSNRYWSIKLTTKKKVYEIINKWIEEWLSPQDMAKEIMKQWEEGVFSKARAEMIAINEIWNAYEYWRRHWINEYKKRTWNMVFKYRQTVEDSRVSKLCRTNQSAGWILFDEVFPSWHRTPTWHPRCRCTTLYQIKKL